MTVRDLAAPIHLVACCAAKLDRPAAAADLYCSDWFTKARAYIEATGTRWFILSAAHGLVKPSQRIEAYNVTLTNMTPAQRLLWAERMILQLRRSIDPRHCGDLVFLAGQPYREHLMAFAGARSRVPMAGLGIGEQKAWLIRGTAALQPYADVSDAAVSDDVDPTHADGMRISPWLDIAQWLADLDRQSTMMAPRRTLYHRFDAKARQLTVPRIRAASDRAAIEQLVTRLSDARYPGGTLHGLEHAWRRDELGTLLVEATNRRTLLALGRDQPHEKGPRLDPARIPDDRLDHLIQTHRNLAMVERCRAERQRRIGCQLSATMKG